MTVKMTLRDSDGVVHFVHATGDSIETLCDLKFPYGAVQVTNSSMDPPTCFWCVLPTRRWIRPPYEPDDPRYHQQVINALLA